MPPSEFAVLGLLHEDVAARQSPAAVSRARGIQVAMRGRLAAEVSNEIVGHAVDEVREHRP